MRDLDDFIGLVRDELGLPVTTADAAHGLEEIPGWDSVLLLHLLVVLERRTGSTLSLPAVLEARSLEGIYALAVAA